MISKKTSLTRRADKLWYKKLFTGICEVCGSPARQVHHFFFKGSYAHLRYDLDNGISLCPPCHYTIHFKDSKIINEKIIEARGPEWYNKLRAKALNRPESSYKTIKYLEDIIKHL